MYGELLNYSIIHLRHQSLRSWLTIIGVVIGIAAIVTLVSIGQGLDKQINDQLKTLGTDIIRISPGATRAGAAVSPYGSNFRPRLGKLYERDQEEVKRVAGITRTTVMLNGRATVSFYEENVTATITGVDGTYDKVVQVKIAEGRFLNGNDRRVVVIGDRIAHDTFEKDVDINRVLTIDNKNFRVVGIFKSSGDEFSTTDNAIFIPLQDLREILRDTIGEDEVHLIMLKVGTESDIEKIGENVKQQLMESHHVTKDTIDFTVVTPGTLSASTSEITNLITVFLGGIAAISLAVGGVGIANTMFMAVVERTKEIGMLKAIGAKTDTIMVLFLIEAALIGGIGGAIGITFALLVLGVLSLVGITTVTTPELLIFSVVFAMIVGIIAGLLPAKQAADLEVVDALAYIG